jgi:hypothetical protein
MPILVGESDKPICQSFADEGGFYSQQAISHGEIVKAVKGG